MATARYFAEAKKILSIGWPIIVTQLTQTGMGFFDTLMAGHYSAHDLAAVALGASLWLPIQVACYGVILALVARVASHTGREDYHAANDDLIYSLIISGLLGLCSCLLLIQSVNLFTLMGIEAALAKETGAYLTAVAYGFPAIMIFQSIRCYYEGFGKTRPVMFMAVATLLINVPLNYIFIFGAFGLPELGGEGCGWATAISMWLALIMSVIYARVSQIFKRSTPFHWQLKESMLGCKTLLIIGIPIGATFLVEVSMFTVIALLLADLGDIVIAAHQITLSFTGTLFMIPLSISMALTIRIGQLRGTEDIKGTQIASRAGLGLNLLHASVVATSIFMAGEPIAKLFTQDIEVIQLTASLLLLAALFQFPDAIQVAAAGTLRGYEDTAIPMVLVVICYWVLALPLGYVLAKTHLLTDNPLGAEGFWLALIVGLSLAAIALGSRVVLKQRQLLAL